MGLVTATLAAVKEALGFRRGPPPAEAVKWMRDREIKPAFSYQDTWGEEQRCAFYVSKMMERDLLSDVKNSLTRALEDGIPFDEWSKNIASTFDESGWSDYNGEAEDNPYRLWTIFDTNVKTALSAAKEE